VGGVVFGVITPLGAAAVICSAMKIELNTYVYHNISTPRFGSSYDDY
jgi:hypothetical protein